jgi:hypothetical protein
VPRLSLEIACDESGHDGERLIGATTDVFAHASVHLDTEAATACMRELRDRIRSPATEYKANHVLREKHRAVLTWLLGPTGPLHGHTHVYLIDKAFHVVGKVIDLLVGEPAMTLALYRDGERALGREGWEAFLASANDLMRARDRLDVRAPVDAFFRVVDALRPAGAGRPVEDVVRRLRQARPLAEAFRTALLDNPTMMSALDPLIPAIVAAVVHWGAGGSPVAIIHDQQNTLTVRRIAQLKEIVPAGRLTSLTLVDSGADPRVQVADILAGAARKIASDELNRRGEAHLSELLRPYVDAFSIWGDGRSWSRLGPAAPT